jgi:hypothetical protein
MGFYPKKKKIKYEPKSMRREGSYDALRRNGNDDTRSCGIEELLFDVDVLPRN